MNAEKFEEWCKNNAVSQDRRSCNGLDYVFVTMKDGWIGIFQYNYGNAENTYAPLIQSADMPHAESYICMREAIPVPVRRL